MNNFGLRAETLCYTKHIMPKQVVSDVTPPGGRRSVRNIPVPLRSYRYRDDAAREEETVEETDATDEPMRIPPPRGGGRRRARWILWSIVVVTILVLGVVVLIATSGATVTVVLKTQPATVAFQGIGTTATTTVGLSVPYQPITVDASEKTSLDPEGNKSVERKAAGTIIVYNNFSTAPQRLIKNTRFETPNGLIFRIPESIIVPGKTTTGGKTVPGSIETPVSADQAGAQYNIALSDFTIPGFKNNAARYAGFYARSKTAMAGGFIGMAPFVSPDKVRAARAALRKTLEDKLVSAAKAKVPDTAVMFSGGYAFTSISVPEVETADKKVEVTERGTLTAFAFGRNALALYIAQHLSIPGYHDAPVSFEKWEEVSFDFINKATFDKANPDGQVRFELRGTGKLTWTLDEERLKTALVGKQKNETVTVLASYPAIERSQVVIRPFWRSAFPENVKKISVVIQNAEKTNP